MKKPWDPGLKRKKSTATINEALDSMLKAYKIERKYSQTSVLNGWEEIVGPVVAKHTSNLYFQKDVLMVQVDSAPLKSELNFQKAKLLHSLQKKYGRSIVANVLIV